MRSILCLLCCIFIIVSCNQTKNQVPVVGSIDTTAIADDTVMQKGFESSYEFHQTLIVHEKLVYDVIGYGGSSVKGEYAILRRGADNKPDTVLHGKREGIIAETFLADSNNNKHEEIYVIFQNPADVSARELLRYESK